MLPESGISSENESDAKLSEKVLQAYEFADTAHRGQFRKSGEPYITHPVRVLNIIRDEFGVTNYEELVCAALLHDVVEDTSVDLETIEKSFGEKVASFVDGASKLRSKAGGDNDKETLKKVIGRSYLEPEVAIIKLADRLDNMRTIDALSEEKRVYKSKETLEVYAPLAESLGMWLVKNELEDLSFKHTNPVVYEKVKKLIADDSRSNELFVRHMESRLKSLLLEHKLTCNIVTRPNGIWAIYEKARKAAIQGKNLPNDFRRIADLISFRVIFEKELDCYSFLGILNREFKEFIDFERFDEFLVNPTDNGYSALHVVLDLDQGAAEIAITTKAREAFNNWGVVELLKSGSKDLSEYVLKLVFTSTGVWFLKKEATGIDLAVLINSERGVKAKEILIEGKPFPLSVVVPNGTDCEIVWGRDDEPVNPEFLFYALPETKRRLEEALVLETTKILIQSGREIMEEILSKRGLLDLADVPGLPERILRGRADESLESIYLLLGGKFVSRETIEKELDGVGITKEVLGLTSIRVQGKDEPKILSDIANLIAGANGNIIAVYLPPIKNGCYDLRFVVKGLNTETEEFLREKLAKDQRFTGSLVV